MFVYRKKCDKKDQKEKRKKKIRIRKNRKKQIKEKKNRTKIQYAVLVLNKTIQFFDDPKNKNCFENKKRI